MITAVLSGKGGAGKTLVSVNLAAAAAEAKYLDCDVEEPNGYLYFKPENTARIPVTVSLPALVPGICTGCRICMDFCRFNALAFIREPVIFEETCHSCGGCAELCPVGALTEKQKEIGHMELGQSKSVKVVTGVMNPGESSGVPVIRNVLKQIEETDDTVVIDCPPGSACTVMESIARADFCLLVAEPTIFAADNLKMVHELVSLMGKPLAVVLNKCEEGEQNPSEEYCNDHQIPILLRILFDEDAGRISAEGGILVEELPGYKPMFDRLLTQIREEVSG